MFRTLCAIGFKVEVGFPSASRPISTSVRCLIEDGPRPPTSPSGSLTQAREAPHLRTMASPWRARRVSSRL